MEISPPQFAGAPCGQSGPYAFYKAFHFQQKDKDRELSLGEFFFVRISALDDPCIGELQLLCTNRTTDQRLASVRLYFLPEQTPDGRLAHHGEDEVLVASDHVVLKLDDLVSWITEEVDWNHGLIARSCNSPVPLTDNPSPDKKEEVELPTLVVDVTEKDETVKAEDGEQVIDTELVLSRMKPTVKGDRGVLILSYQSYCRYRTALRRVEGFENNWLKNALVIALGGFTLDSHKTHVLFCRDTFDHDELAQHELNCEYLAPTLKGKRRKKKGKNARSTSPESITSDEGKDSIKNNHVRNGIKQPPCKTEQEFLQRLFKFMKKRSTPIHRVPHLGFKQIDLYVFFSFAQKLGGYDKITCKKLWKHVYDELGGNPGSTSAATCTRRHYERLLLPFERHLDGIEYKPSQKKKSQKKKIFDKETNGLSEKQDGSVSASAEIEDAYTFTDSETHENSNSKDSISNEEFHSICDDSVLMNETFSDDDSKTVWSIQKPPDVKDEVDKDDSKAIKPLIIQKGQGETFAEKERKWDEIRRKNAAARKWVRQSRSSRGSKSLGQDDLSIDPEAAIKSETDMHDGSCHELQLSPKIKSETSDVDKNFPVFANQVKIKEEINQTDPQAYTASHNVNQLHPNVADTNHHLNKLEYLNRQHMLASQTPPDKKMPVQIVKSEPCEGMNKSWCGYSGNSDNSSYQSTMYSGLGSYPPGSTKGHAPNSYKTGTRSEPDVTRDFMSHHTGRHSVESISASSIVSAEALTTDEKPLFPQRRPSVIQHTEYAASPSPSLSPKQTTPPDVQRNVSPKEPTQTISFSSPKINNLLPNQLSYSMTGKVAEWLTKGAREAVACKTPSTKAEKPLELHDKVMMPSSCKTPGAGTGKVPTNAARSKHNVAHLANPSSKSSRSKYAATHKQRNSDGAANTARSSAATKSDIRNNMLCQKSFHPIPTSYSPYVMTNSTSAPKYDHSVQPPSKLQCYPNPGMPHRYSQPKPLKTTVAPSPLTVGPRPPLLPYGSQQMYRTAPLIDVPKASTFTNNEYENTVLDLSMKKQPVVPPKPTTVPINSLPQDENGCLDLSMKKRLPHLSGDNGIENITPPLPMSPNSSLSHPTSYLSSPSLKPVPTLISLQEMAVEESLRQSMQGGQRPPSLMSATTSTPLPIMPPNASMYLAATHSKASQNLISTLPQAAYSKDMAKSLYHLPNAARHSQFSPYVIPPFFPSHWTTVVSSATSANAKQVNNTQPSPMAYKGAAKHKVYPKDYPYNAKAQFHHNSHHPSNSK